MKCGGKVTILALSGVLLNFGVYAATADAGDGPYHSIVDRNVFNIHPAPPPPSPESLMKKEPLPKIILNGITTILGTKTTFLTIPGGKPGAPPETLMLTEGQGQNDIEVKEIDDKAGVVKVSNHGEAQTLDFDHDGTKPQAPAGAPAMPASLPPIPAVPPPNVNPAPQAPVPNVIRPMRGLSRSPLSGNNSMGGGSFGGGMMGGSSAATANVQNAGSLTTEQNTLLMEAQRMKYIQEGDPTAKILPPTDETPGVLNSMGQGQAAQ